MSTTFDVAVFVGSLRRASFTRRIANALEEVAPRSLTLTIIEIGQLPMYNQDLDDGEPPAEWTEFRRQVKAADAVLFATPEYNRSVPGVLKNAIDVGSRPYGQSVWDGKPGAVVSVSPGAIGGFGANHHLRQSLVFLDVPVLQQPEVYLGEVDKLFDADNRLVVGSVRDLLSMFLRAFHAWSLRTRRAAPEPISG
jgi:chromate reductase, NAD(P)H dehydrogenase (quinone)